MSQYKPLSIVLLIGSTLAILLAASNLLQPNSQHPPPSPQPPPPTGQPTTPLPQPALATSFPSITRPHQNLAAITQIRQTLSLYPFLIDGKQFDSLDLVFHENVWTNYGALIGDFHPLSVLKEGLRKAVEVVTSMHLFGTQLVDVDEGGDMARSATYFSAGHFGTGEKFGEALWAWGIYQDNWIRNESTGEWRIIQRTLSYPGENGQVPFFGDVSVLGYE